MSPKDRGRQKLFEEIVSKYNENYKSTYPKAQQTPNTRNTKKMTLNKAYHN